mgnify:CR=1 FL=1
MVIEYVTSLYYKSHELAQASLLWGIVAQVSDVAHGPLVIISCVQQWSLGDWLHEHDANLHVRVE